MHPQFICLGAQKAGTDWVYDQFESHKDYWMPPVKEIAFFDAAYGQLRYDRAQRQLNWKLRDHGLGKADYTYDLAFLIRMLNGRPKPHKYDFEAYFSLFENKPGLVGDCTPGYCRLTREMAAQMYEQMPGTMFLLMVRDPAERVWSQTTMHVREKRSTDEILSDFQAFKDFVRRQDVVALSFLSKTIETWRSVDNDGRFKVFQFDNLKVDAEAYRRSVAEHVGADPDGFAIAANFNKKANHSHRKTVIPPHFRVWLGQYLHDEFAALEQLIGGHATRWRENNDAILKEAGADATAAE